MCHLLISCNFFILPNVEATWYLLATKPCKVKQLNHINMGDFGSSLSNLRSSADNFSGNRCYYRHKRFKTTQPCAKASESSKQPMSLNHFNYTFTLCTCTGGFQPKYYMNFLIIHFVTQTYTAFDPRLALLNFLVCHCSLWKLAFQVHQVL